MGQFCEENTYQSQAFKASQKPTAISGSTKFLLHIVKCQQKCPYLILWGSWLIMTIYIISLRKCFVLSYISCFYKNLHPSWREDGSSQKDFPFYSNWCGFILFDVLESLTFQRWRQRSLWQSLSWHWLCSDSAKLWRRIKKILTSIWREADQFTHLFLSSSFLCPLISLFMWSLFLRI